MDSGVEWVLLDYFQDIFKASYFGDDYKVIDYIQPKITAEMEPILLRDVIVEEVKGALFQMKSSTAPKLDGMPSVFFQKYWEIEGPDIAAVIFSFISTGKILKKINFTQVCLIPNVKVPTKMAQLRPISLCNVIFKIMSKVIGNCL